MQKNRRNIAESLGGLGILLSLLSRHPGELWDRAFGYVDLGSEHLFGGKPDYETVRWQTAIRDLEPGSGLAAEILAEPALRDVEEETRRILRRVHHENPRGAQWPADSVLARCCYLACRLIKPEAVVETGVAYGVTSAFILKALEENGHGTLHSIDLPPLRRAYQRFWGIAVPETLQDRWRLHRGSSARVLPRLLREVRTVHLFVHDSLHTRRNMRREFDTVWPRLRNGAVLLADDVERNRAFGELRQKSPALWRVVQEREESPLHGRAAPVVFGIAIK